MTFLKSIVWTAVIAVVLLIAATVLVILYPVYAGLAVVLALGSVTLAILAHRE